MIWMAKIGNVQKAVIGGFLRSNVINGVNDFIREQKPSKVKELMDDIEKEVKKRNNGNGENDTEIATSLVTVIFKYTGKWIAE